MRRSMQRELRFNAVNSRGLDGQRAFASTSRSLLADPETFHDPTPPSSQRTTGLFGFSSRRQLNLHAFDPSSRRVDYVETKIGGHPQDHRLLLQARPSPRGPLKTLPGAVRIGSSQSRAFETHERPALEYAPTKIGGHALDHVPFFDRGLPSRPLWGFSLPPVVVYPGRAQVVAPVEAVPRGLANVYACSRCRRLRQSPRVQLCCGHTLCAACLASDDLRHVVSGSASCFLECLQCSDFVAMEAVVFPPDRVLLVDHADGAATTLLELKQRARSLRLRWQTGSAVAALALLASGKLLSPRMKKTALERNLAEEAVLLEAAGSDETIEEGDARWQKRMASLHAPSKLLKFSFVRTLGVGNFAEVMLVRDRKGALCVLKESDKLQEAVNEIGLLSKIRSPHVVEIREYFVEEIGHRHFAYIVMEYCDQGDLLQQIKTTGALSGAKFNAIFRQLCIGLSEIHAKGIVHRDLKPGNVLLTSEGIAKIADFGVSTCLESNLLTHHAAGTLAFMAPEVRRYFLGEDVSYDTKADIWSLGVLAVALLSGDPEPRVATRVVDEVVEELVEKYALSDLHATLLQRTLDIDPRKRPSLSELLEMVPPMNARL